MPPARRPRRAARRFAAADVGVAGSCKRTWCNAGPLGCGVASAGGAGIGSRGPLRWRGQVPRASGSGSTASPARAAA
eukprot:10293206-Alexandrium_andersonii.AAC.1